MWEMRNELNKSLENKKSKMSKKQLESKLEVIMK